MNANAALKQAVITALRKVRDPEIPVNLYDLGLIYDLDVSEGGSVRIRMTLTTPNCPVAESMPLAVRQAVESVEGVSEAAIELVWEPPWTSERMSEDARLQLEMLGIAWSDPHSKAGPRGTSLTIGGRPGNREEPRGR